ncbi:putative Polycomb group protein ASXL1 isoform X2 [Rhinatrema bivittatum]|uniref:putative Polycomb group protein ASXL1 isoform X2 n=1 Tax=Rhinatrema bivittatum TaxID=194408 RepID=UPI00112D57D7|nr:putative Polycomb group protein ASXL1 isoform X2 [Rhinatrema bivittatum]
MKDKQKRKKERTWAEAARMVLENYSDAPMTPKQILQVIEAEGLKEMSGASPLACLNTMLHSNSRGTDALFYKLPGRISLFTLKDALQWSRSLSVVEVDEPEDAVDGESCGSTEASTVSGGDNDGSPDETSSNASCSTESHSQLLSSTSVCSRPISQASKQKKKTGVMLPRVVLTPLKVNGTQVESASAFTGRHGDGEMSSTSTTNYNTLPVCSSSLLSSTPPHHLQSMRKTSGGQVKRNRGEEIDFETPGSILVNTNLRALLNLRTFGVLPPHCQQQLLLLLPEVDRQVGVDGQLRLSSTALNNEFFTHAAQSWQERLADGEFTHEMQVRIRQEMEKEKKVESWKGKFFEDYYGQKLGLTKEDVQQTSVRNVVENKVELCIQAEAVRLSHSPSGRLRDGHLTKHSWPELRIRARRSLYKMAKTEESETVKGQISLSLDDAHHKESKIEVDSRSCQISAVSKDGLNLSSHEPERLAVDSSSFGFECNIPYLPQEISELESKDQKRRCFEQTASTSFPEKKPRLEDRRSFRNTIKSVYTEKLQPTKEEPRVPPIKIQLSRIKPPWLVKGQQAYQICPRIIPNSKSSRRGRTRAGSLANIKTRAETETAAASIGGGGDPGGGGGGSTDGGGGWQQFCNDTKTRASKRTCGKHAPNFKRTQLLSSCCIDAEKINIKTVIKPLKINWTICGNHFPANEDNFTLRHATSLVEFRVETHTVDASLSDLFASSQLCIKPSETSKETTFSKEFCDPEAPSSAFVIIRGPALKPYNAFHEEQLHCTVETLNQGTTNLQYMGKRSTINPVENINILSRTEEIPTLKSSHDLAEKYASLGCAGFATALESMSDTKKYWEPFNEVQFTESDLTAVVYLTINDSSASDNDANLKMMLKKNWPEHDCREKIAPADKQIRKRQANSFIVESSSSLHAIGSVGTRDIENTPKDCVLQLEELPVDEGKLVNQQILRQVSRNGHFESQCITSHTMDTASESDMEIRENVEVMCCETSKLKNSNRNILGINHCKPFIQTDKMKGDCQAHHTQPVSMLKNREESQRWNLVVPQRALKPLNHSSTVNEPRSAYSARLFSSVEARNPLFAHLFQSSLDLDKALSQIPSSMRQENLSSSLWVVMESHSVKNKTDNIGPRERVPSWGWGSYTANEHKDNGIFLDDLYFGLQFSADSAPKNSHDMKVFPRLEGLMNQPSVLGINFPMRSRDCSEEVLSSDVNTFENFFSKRSCSFSFEDQEMFSSSLAYFQPLPSDLGKNKSLVNSEESTVPGVLSLNITSSASLISETSVDKSYFGILEKNLIGAVSSGNTSSPNYNLGISQSMLERVLCPARQVLADKKLVCHGEARLAQEEWLLKQHLNDLNSRKSKHIPDCQGPIQNNIPSRKEAVYKSSELTENLQSMPLIMTLPFFKPAKSTGKELSQPQEPSSILSQVSIKQALYRKLWKLHLNSTDYSYAANDSLEGLRRNFVAGVKQLGHKAKFTATNNSSLSMQMFAENNSLEQISVQSSCSLKAMIMCKGCGAFCHDNCIGPSKLCVLCLVVR